MAPQLTEVLQSVTMAGTMQRQKIRLELLRMCGRWLIRSGRSRWHSPVDGRVLLRMVLLIRENGVLSRYRFGKHIGLESCRRKVGSRVFV